jgi:hypothetical protein
MIQMVREATAKPLNAAPQFPGQAMTFKGVPSIGAIQAVRHHFKCATAAMMRDEVR